MKATKTTPGRAFDVDRAIEVFVRGFCYTRSFTHPYQADRVGAAWVVRDGPRKRKADYRREEWVIHGMSAAGADRVARENTRGRFCICAVRPANEPDAPMRAEYKALGYRLGTTEPFMIHRLVNIPKMEGPLPVQQVMTRDFAEEISLMIDRRKNISESRREALDAQFAKDSPIRQYVAMDGNQPVGWSRTINVGESTWVSGVHVLPKYRRRGIGRSVLNQMLRTDREHGCRQSVLLASHTGALLYANVGYEMIAESFLYTPKKK